MNPEPEIRHVERMAYGIRNLENWAAGELLELANADGISANAHMERLHHLEYVISCAAGFVKINAEKMAELSIEVRLLNADEAAFLANYRNASKANQKTIRQLALRGRNASHDPMPNR